MFQALSWEVKMGVTCILQMFLKGLHLTILLGSLGSWGVFWLYRLCVLNETFPGVSSLVGRGVTFSWAHLNI